MCGMRGRFTSNSGNIWTAPVPPLSARSGQDRLRCRCVWLTVHEALVRDGVPDGAIAEAWRGKENPAVPTPDGVCEPRDRRVEIVE
jgi:hypothetical protein